MNSTPQALASLLLVFIFSTSFAQEAPSSSSTTKFEKMVVTGSYIRRAADEGAPSPVTTIDNSKAQEAGSYSAAGAVRDNAVISSGGSNNVSFHGQSSANNLVLLNGLRLPKPAGGDSVNIDFIPASAIERIEILKDGASALYGSEALAGVVNIITKKDYDGANISLRLTQPEMGIAQESNVVATYGKNFSKGNLLAVFQYRGNEPYMYRDTDFGITDVKTAGSLTSFPGNLQRGNTFYRAADCPADRVDSNGACRYNHYNTRQLGADRNYYNLLMSGGYDLSDKYRIEASLLLAHQFTRSLNTPKIINFEDLSAGGGPNYEITDAMANQWTSFLNGNPTFTSNPGDPPLKFLYSADEELGIERSQQVLNNGTAQIKIGRQADDFDFDFAVGYGVSDFKDEVYDGNANTQILYQKLKTGSWNPFAQAGSKGDLSDALVDTWNSNFADIWNARLIASGKMIDWGERSLYAAYGLEGQIQRYNFRADNLSLQNIPLTGLFSNQNGDRDVQSFFVELSQNPFSNLQLQAAVRLDKYSDFGSTINPKLAFGYKVNEQFSVRGSYGTGFKAPDLRSLYQGNVTRPQRFRDRVKCPVFDKNNPNCSNLFSTTTRGDANLDAELGEHFNFGLQIRPKKNWQINIDHWRASGTDALESVNIGRLTQAEAKFGPGILNDLGVTIQRDSDNQIQYVLVPLKSNSGRYKVNGIDLEIKYKNTLSSKLLGPLNYTFKFDHSHTLSSGSQPFFFQAYERQLDLNWRNITSFLLGKNSHVGSLRLRTFSATDKDNTRNNSNGGYGSIPTFTEFDVHYEYYGAWEGVVTVGIRNLFDRRLFNNLNSGGPGFALPVADNTSLGRTFYVGYSQDF